AEGVTGTWADAESKALNQQLAAAVRRGAQSEVERLSRDQVRVREQRERRAYDRLRSQGLDPQLLDLHARLSALSYTNRTERAAVVRQVAARLGEVSLASDGSQNAAPRYDATGYAKRQGLLLELGWVSFRDATTG